MTDPRALLNAYAEVPNMNVIPIPCTPEHMAPLAFAALRAVLAECDFLDHCIADYKGHEVAALIRNSITRALESSP